MKKTYKNLLGLGLCLSIGTASFSQVINESFTDVTTLAASGWVMNNLSTPVGTNPTWFQGANPPFAANSGAATEYIGCNYNSVAGAATISNWLITPSRTFQNGDVVTFFTRTVDAPAYADNLQVRLSVNGTSTNVGTTNTSVGDFTTLLLELNPTLNLTSYPSVWTQYTITVSGLPMALTGRLAFRYYVPNGGPTGANSDFIGIDDFAYTPVGGGSANVTVDNNPSEYTIVPLPQVTAITIGTTIRNIGTVGTSDAVVTAKIYLAPDFVTPVQTFVSPATVLAPAANAPLTVGSFTPSTIGDYYVEYTASCTGNTLTSADTSGYFVSIDDNEYARDNSVVTASVGIGAGPTGYIGSKFVVNTATNLDSVLIALNKSGEGGAAIGDSTRISIFNVSGGLPTTLIGTSAKYVFTAADTLGLVVTTHTVNAVGGGSLSLVPGTYFVAVTEYNTNVGVATCDAVFRTNTVYASWTGQPWTAVETFGAGFAKTPVIRPYLNTCINTTGSQTLSLCAGQSVTVGTSTYSMTGVFTDILANASGCDSTVTTNLTVNSINNTTSLSSLTITSNQTGATYQWIDCGSGLAIAGETNMSYTATANGSYAVIVSIGSCSDTSACVVITSVGIANINAANSVVAFPNPGTGLYKIDLNTNSVVIVTNILGETVLNVRMSKGTQNINIQDQPKGVYFLKVLTGDNQQTIRLIKE